MKPIPNTLGYFADKLGNIYSRRRFLKLRKMKQQKLPNGYKRVMIYDEHSVPHSRLVHELILTTFVGLRPDGMRACHGENGITDNSLKNLYWATQKQNMKDKYRDGTQQTGERSPSHKLNELQVRIIRRAYGKRNKGGLSTPKLAKFFGVSQSAIYWIVTNKNWSYMVCKNTQTSA